MPSHISIDRDHNNSFFHSSLAAQLTCGLSDRIHRRIQAFCASRRRRLSSWPLFEFFLSFLFFFLLFALIKRIDIIVCALCVCLYGNIQCGPMYSTLGSLRTWICYDKIDFALSFMRLSPIVYTMCTRYVHLHIDSLLHPLPTTDDSRSNHFVHTEQTNCSLYVATLPRTQTHYTHSHTQLDRSLK